MADETTKNDKGTQKPKEEKAERTERTFPVSQLINESRATLGVPRHVAAGAFHDEKPDAELTKREAKAAVRSFFNRKAAAS